MIASGEQVIEGLLGDQRELIGLCDHGVARRVTNRCRRSCGVEAQVGVHDALDLSDQRVRTLEPEL